MKSVYTVQRLSFLSDDDKALVHSLSMRILGEVGLKVRNTRAIKLLEKAGCKTRDERVLIPEQAVAEALRLTAKRFTLEAANESHSLAVDADSDAITFGTGGQALYVLRRKQGAFDRSAANGEDLREILGLCERLANVDFVTRPVEPQVEAERMDEEKSRIFAKSTTKPMNLANLVQPKKLDRVVATIGRRELLSFITCLVVSPLSIDDRAADKLITIAENDIPVSISSCTQGGATAPLSELGELAQLNAEVLSGFVLANAVRPGAKVFYRGIPITSDLLTDGSPRWCQPDSIRRIALATEMCRSYGLPCCGTAAVSDEKEPTAQAITEKTLGWIFEGAAGAHYINSALGMLEQVLTVSPEQYVIDDIILGQIKERLSATPPEKLPEFATGAARRALETFGVHPTEEDLDEIRSRIDFIYDKKEEYGADNADRQLETVRKACTGSSGSNVFIRDARRGIRQGFLYQGARIEGELDFSTIDGKLQAAETA